LLVNASFEWVPWWNLVSTSHVTVKMAEPAPRN
jgi:hypothetical protein